MIRRNNVTDCSKCRKLIHEREKTEFAKEMYRFFRDNIQMAECFTIAAVLWSMAKKGRSKKYIKETFDDLCMMFESDNLFGKEITTTQIMKNLEDEYGIDFHRVKVNVETEKQFMKEYKENEKG